MSVWPPLCSSQCLSQRIKLSAKYLKYSWENKRSLLNFWGWKVGEGWDLKGRTARGINGRQSAPGNKRPSWHCYGGFTSSQSQSGNGAHLVLFFLPWHNKTAVRLRGNSFHLILPGFVAHYFQTSGVGKPVLFNQP